MISEQFKGLPLDPESAMMNIDAMVNAALFLNLMVEHETLAVDVLTVASDYISVIRKEQERVIQEGQ